MRHPDTDRVEPSRATHPSMQARPGRKPQSTREEQVRPLASANMTFLGSVALVRLASAWAPLRATASARTAASSGSLRPERAMERERELCVRELRLRNDSVVVQDDGVKNIYCRAPLKYDECCCEHGPLASSTGSTVPAHRRLVYKGMRHTCRERLCWRRAREEAIAQLVGCVSKVQADSGTWRVFQP